MKKNILAIGAYERDNFGDLLFFQVLRDSLRGMNVIAGSILYSDMVTTLGEKVLPYPVLLEKERWDAVWVVGGEVGGVDIERAYSMSLGPDILQYYHGLSPEKKLTVHRALSGNSVPVTAYLPLLSSFKLNRNTPLIINSVGIANTELLEENTKRESIEILRTARALVVRDERSQKFCVDNGLDYELLPDAVHSISTLSEWNKLRKRNSKKASYITFQINQALLQNYDRKYVASILAKIIRNTGMNIVMIAAGTAVHHDSYAEYQRLKMLTGAKVGHNKIEIQLSRSPVAIVESIVNSRLWIGTSLHGRIVASSFHVPRISLSNQKVAAYARTWDKEFPFDTKLEELMVEVEQVLSREYTAKQIDKDTELANRAKDNLIKIAGTII